MKTADLVRTAKTELTVAILLNDANEAKKIASSFRKLGIIAHYYDTLRSFWDATASKYSELPDFAVIDVAKMSEGNLALINHPRIKENDIHFAFYYNDSSLPLLDSTYEIFHFGNIRESINYDGQLKSILNRVNEFREASFTATDASKRLRILQQKNAKLIGSIHDHKEKSDFEMLLSELILDIEENCKEGDFIESALERLSAWHPVEALGISELTANCQRLVSGSYRIRKYREFPSLWLGQICRNGIEKFAENMALQAALDIFGGSNIVTLKLKGTKAHAEMLIFMQVEQDYIANFNWTMLEKAMTSLYRRSLLERKEVTPRQNRENSLLNPWDLMTLLENDFNQMRIDASNAEMDKQLVNLNFANLNTIIKDSPKLRFNWAAFHKDFIFHLNRAVKNNYLLTHWGTEHVSFVVERTHFEDFYTALRNFSMKFAYWRYFEDSSDILNMDLSPELKVIPFSPMAYLNYVERAAEPKKAVTIPQKRAPRPRSFTLNRAPTLDM